MKTKIYVGCSLIHATQEFRDSIELFKQMLAQEGFEVIKFKGMINGKPNGTPEEIYRYDIDCVNNCDFFIAECSFPSTGLGIEIGRALALEKPILAIAKKDAIVSSMVLGNDSPGYTFFQYENVGEVIDLIKEKIKRTLF